MKVRRSPVVLPAVEPIIPELHGVPFDGPDWVFEPKFDGFRGLLHENCEILRSVNPSDKRASASQRQLAEAVP